MGLSIHDIEIQPDAKWFTLRLRGHSWLVQWKFSGYIVTDKFWFWLISYDPRISHNAHIRDQRLDFIAEIPNDSVDQFERELFLIMTMGETALDTLKFAAPALPEHDED